MPLGDYDLTYVDTFLAAAPTGEVSAAEVLFMELTDYSAIA